MKRLRGIWAEGTFAGLKREHNLIKIKKRGLSRAKEECLLSALTLNLKRIVRVIEERKKTTICTFLGMIIRTLLKIYQSPAYCLA
jgi:hypothetical protein